MNKKNGTITSILIAVILMIAYYYFSWHYTFYGLGIFLIPFILLLSVLTAFIAIRFKHKWKRSFWLVFSSITSLLFTGLLISIAIDKYKPTFYIYVPENYEGMIYLLPAKEPTRELFVNENGIGYYNSGVDSHVKVKQGKNDISNALNQYGRRSLIFMLPDSIQYRAIEIVCFEVVQGRGYGSSIWNQPHATCMDEQKFIEMVNEGKIDSTLLTQRTYPVSPKN